MGLKAINAVEEREFREVVERRGVDRGSKTADTDHCFGILDNS